MQVTSSITGVAMQQLGTKVQQLESNGYHGVNTQENAYNPFLPLAVAATQSQTLALKTSVAIAFARSPMVAANLGWDLQSASNGRFTLGLGSQVKGHNVRRFSVPWSAPAPRLREYVQAVRAIWQSWQHGDKLDYQGEHYQFSLMTPNFTPPPLNGDTPPIHISAVGPAMMKVAGEECDGVMLHPFCTPKYAADVIMPRLQAALTNKGKQRENFQITGGGFVASGEDDAAVAKAFEWVRQRIGFYGSTPSYWPVLECHDLLDLGHKLNHMSKNNQWQQMTAEISDDVVRLFTAVGRFDELIGAVTQHFKHNCDVLNVGSDLPQGLVQDITKIPTAFTGYASSSGGNAKASL